MKECRVIIIINEETGELLKNELIGEELADQISGIVEEGFIETYEQCETVCSNVSKMLDDAGISTEDHDEMIEELEKLKLVKKDVEDKKVIKPKKTRKIIRKKKISCGCE